MRQLLFRHRHVGNTSRPPVLALLASRIPQPRSMANHPASERAPRWLVFQQRVLRVRVQRRQPSGHVGWVKDGER